MRNIVLCIVVYTIITLHLFATTDVMFVFTCSESVCSAVMIRHIGPASSQTEGSTESRATAHSGYIASVTPADLNIAIDFWLIVLQHQIRMYSYITLSK